MLLQESKSTNRLNFSLPEFTRIVWASEEAREIWEPRFQAINMAWIEIERSTVLEGIRPGGVQSVSPDDLIKFQSWCVRHDIEHIILHKEGVAPVYGNALTPVMPGEPWNYRVYFGRNVKFFLNLWDARDEVRIASALGYPICCARFFQKYWYEEGWRDLTIPMIQVGSSEGPHTCNILLRHLGIRPVFHLPCSFECIFTAVMGERILKHGSDIGYNQEMTWLDEILRWPILWSSLHGAAIITTPIVKIITSSDAVDPKVTIERKGSIYPEGAASGVDFPFQKPPKLISLNSWSDNGFTNSGAMKRAHKVILDALRHISLNPGRLLDLGCGNGLLLEKIVTEFSQLTPYGVEMDQRKHALASTRIGDNDNISFGNIYNYHFKHPYEVILISLNRLKEMEIDRVQGLIVNLWRNARYLILYEYDPWDSSLDFLFVDEWRIVQTESDGTTEARVLVPNL